jgi:hypothetical protein
MTMFSLVNYVDMRSFRHVEGSLIIIVSMSYRLIYCVLDYFTSERNVRNSSRPFIWIDKLPVDNEYR